MHRLPLISMETKIRQGRETDCFGFNWRRRRKTANIIIIFLLHILLLKVIKNIILQETCSKCIHALWGILYTFSNEYHIYSVMYNKLMNEVLTDRNWADGCWKREIYYSPSKFQPSPVVMSSIVDKMSECLHMVAGITLWNSMELRTLDGAWSRTTPSLRKGELGLASDQDASLMSSSRDFY